MMGSDDLLLEVEGVVDLHSIFSGRREDSKFEIPFAIPVAEGDFNINRLTNKRFQERVLGDARGINLNRASAIGHRIGRVATAALGNRALEGIDVQRDGVIGFVELFQIRNGLAGDEGRGREFMATKFIGNKFGIAKALFTKVIFGCRPKITGRIKNNLLAHFDVSEPFRGVVEGNGNRSVFIKEVETILDGQRRADDTFDGNFGIDRGFFGRIDVGRGDVTKGFAFNGNLLGRGLKSF